LVRLLTAALTSGAVIAVAHAGDIVLDNAFARATPGSATVGAAFLTVTNAGTSNDRLIAAASPVAGRTELHTHIKDGEIMRMRPVEAIDVPAGGSVRLEPGGFHVMLLELKAPLRQGEAFPLTLTFAEAGSLTVSVPVKSPAEMPPMQGHGH
jgi:copper(I)-binding protein